MRYLRKRNSRASHLSLASSRFAAGEAVAIYKSRSDSLKETRYLHRDHLGNLTEITDESGAVVESLSCGGSGA